METIYNLIRIGGQVLMAALVALLFAACDLVQEAPTLAEEDLEVTADIVASSLAQNSEGLLADLSDLTADVSRDGMYYGSVSAGKSFTDEDERRKHRSYTATYDPETGVHTIAYERSFEGDHFSKSLEANLQYIFHSIEGGYLEFPRRHWEQVASIEFSGYRKGHVSGARTDDATRKHSNTFERSGDWALSGLNGSADAMTLVGEQTNEGTHQIIAQDSPDGAERLVAERVYTMRLSTEDATIQKGTGDLEHELSGTIAYEMTVTVTRGDETRTREHEGTIELEGNGRALLRFIGLRKAFVIDLERGTVDRQE